MREVWKYRLVYGRQGIRMPLNARLLYATTQGDDVVLYALIDPYTSQASERVVWVIATGEQAPIDDWQSLGVIARSNTGFMFHVFAEKE